MGFLCKTDLTMWGTYNCYQIIKLAVKTPKGSDINFFYIYEYSKRHITGKLELMFQKATDTVRNKHIVTIVTTPEVRARHKNLSCMLKTKHTIASCTETSAL